MVLKAESLSKSFSAEWIISDFSYTFFTSKIYGIKGPNGIGKSTLLQLLSSKIIPSKGSLSFEYQGRSIPISNFYKYVSFTAPYIDLIEEFSLNKLIDFHFHFFEYFPGIDKSRFLDIIGLASHKKKEFAQFSSGMKQKCKIAFAVLTNRPILLMDEPTSNLDEDAIAWFKALIAEFAREKIVVIASNSATDLEICTELIDVNQYK